MGVAAKRRVPPCQERPNLPAGAVNESRGALQGTRWQSRGVRHRWRWRVPGRVLHVARQGGSEQDVPHQIATSKAGGPISRTLRKYAILRSTSLKRTLRAG